MDYLTIILATLIGGVLFRARGGWPSIPRPIEQMLFCLPILLVTLPEWYAPIIYLLSVAACCKGHGHNMDLGTWKPPVDYEWYEFHKPLHGKISEYWYDAIGLAISGLTYTLPLIVTHPHLAWIGILKAPAYMIGWTEKLPEIRIKKLTFAEPTEWGEFFTGAFIWGFITLLHYVL